MCPYAHGRMQMCSIFSFLLTAARLCVHPDEVFLRVAIYFDGIHIRTLVLLAVALIALESRLEPFSCGCGVCLLFSSALASAPLMSFLFRVCECQVHYVGVYVLSAASLFQLHRPSSTFWVR